MAEPETPDFQLMVSSLQGVIRENERTMADLRSELDTRRQELSTVVVAKAQLEGRLREVERRLADARHLIDLQREELIFIRTERERALQSRLRGPSRPKAESKASPADLRGGAVSRPPAPALPPAEAPAAIGGDDVGPPPSSPPASDVERSSSIQPVRDLPEPDRVLAQAPADRSTMATLLHSIGVKAGDTLFSLARRYGVNLRDLRAANGLQDDRILVGQALVLPAPRERSSR